MTHLHRFRHSALALRATLELTGKSCAFATNDANVLRAVSRWLRDAAPADFEMTIFVDGDLPHSTAAPVFRGMDHLVFASLGNECFGLDLLRKRVFGVVSAKTASDPTFWNEILLPITMGILGCSIGVVPMHCACLEWKGAGVLVAGRSGAGKSTLSAALAQQGFSFVSDDWTYMSERERQPVAHGLGVPIKLLPDTRRFFDALKEQPVRRSMNGELAFEIDPAVLQATSKVSTEPKRLLLLRRETNGSPRFSSVSSGVVRQFFEASGERLPKTLQQVRERRSAVIDTVASLDTYEFTYSGSPHSAAKVIREFMEQ